MTVTEIMEQVRSEMTGDLQKDLLHLRDVAYDLRRESNATELLEAIAEYAYEMMPEDIRKRMEETTFVRGKRMDMVFSEALKLVQERNTAEAEPILADISEKIAQHYENGSKKWFSFRNPFEYHMYRYYYPNDREFDRAPFDFSHYLTLYGFVLLENKHARKAALAVERAIRFNPVNCESRFEMAEIYKFTHATRKLLQINQETLRFCTSADRIARVLANMGFYCTAVGDFYEAAVFYFESLRFRSSRPIELELQDVLRRMKSIGQKFAPPTHGQTIDTYEKYGLQPPPNSELINLALTLANSAQEYGRPELEGLFYRVAYDLTNDPHFKKELDRIDAELGNTRQEEPS